MQADEVHHDDSAGESRARSGPRHAAPRKPLLTRLQMPAGKAIALAAMPSAVLMGMGLTPTLAQAKPGVPKNPFRDGPCVTAPDDASKDLEKEAKDAKDAKDAEDAKKKAEQDEAAKDEAAKDEAGKGEGGKDSTEPTPSSSGDKAGTDKSGSGDGDKDTAEEPEPDPTPSKTKNPWDPLGVGDALKDVFTPDKPADEPSDKPADEKSPDATPSPSASEETKPPEDKAKAEDKVEDTVKDTTDKVTKPVEDGADALKDKADELKDKAEGDDSDKAEEPEESADPMAPDADGKKPFPCVVEKKVDGDAEQTPVPIPDDPWQLEASSLLLKGLDYKGVVNLTTAGGKKKQALKFTVDNGTDIGDLHQIAPGPDGSKYHIKADEGSTSTIRDGQTIMYTERLQGNLFGLIPIVFDPEHPPPLNVPIAYFTKVKVTQAAQFGGTLTVPGLEQTIDR
ncbi:hypothetical protein [Streptomyces venezuelae]